MARRGRYSLTSLLRHPLLVALPVFLLINMAGLGDSAKLLLIEPVALASGSPDGEAAQIQEPVSAEIVRLRGELAALATANELLRQGHSQLADLEVVPLAAGAIPAKIIVRSDSATFRHSIYINRGTDHGVRPGHAVTVGQVLVGTVYSASAGVSVVRLITDPGSRIPVSILPRNGPELAGDATSQAKPPNAPAPGRSLSDLSLLTEESPPSSQGPTPGQNLSGLRLAPSGLPPIEDASAAGPRQKATRGVLYGGTDRTRPRLPVLPIRDVDVDSGVVRGMLVVTSESLGTMPGGLLVGFVDTVHSRNTFLDVEVAAAVDLSLVDVVTVIPFERPTLDQVSRMLAPDHQLDGGK